MVGLLTFLFILLSLFLALFIYIQQGKGDMGMGQLSGGSQSLFGGSGGQTFFEKATWIMAGLFIAGALCLSILKTATSDSRLTHYKAPNAVKKQTLPKPATANETKPVA